VRGPLSDVPPTSRRSVMIPKAPLVPSSEGGVSRPLSVPPPPAQVAIFEAPLPQLPQLDLSGLDDIEDPLAYENVGFVPPNELPEDDDSSSSRPRISLLGSIDENEIAEILELPARESMLPAGERSPMSRRSWVPPKRLSLPPGALSMSAPSPARAAASLASPAAPERGRRTLFVVSVLAVFFVLVFVFAPPIQPARSIRGGTVVHSLLRSGLGKHVTGYLLAALCVLSLGISLRKRWRRFSFGDVSVWRAVHSAVVAASLVMLFLHTGLSAGSNLNFVLFVDFLGATLLGGVAGLVVIMSEHWTPLAARNRRLHAAFLHVVLTWPLPILVTLHVLAVYYF
jgi:hypothetical protein